MLENYLQVGYILKTHSLHGALALIPTTDFSEERFKRGTKLALLDKTTNTLANVTVQNARPHKNTLIVTFKELTTIEQSEVFVKSFAYIHKNNAVLPDEYVYLSELTTYSVYLEDDTLIGKVSEVLEYASYYTLRVKRENQADVLIPYTEPFIIETKKTERKIIFRPIAGML